MGICFSSSREVVDPAAFSTPVPIGEEALYADGVSRSSSAGSSRSFVSTASSDRLLYASASNSSVSTGASDRSVDSGSSLEGSSSVADTELFQKFCSDCVFLIQELEKRKTSQLGELKIAQCESYDSYTFLESAADALENMLRDSERLPSGFTDPVSVGNIDGVYTKYAIVRYQRSYFVLKKCKSGIIETELEIREVKKVLENFQERIQLLNWI